MPLQKNAKKKNDIQSGYVSKQSVDNMANNTGGASNSSALPQSGWYKKEDIENTIQQQKAQKQYNNVVQKANEVRAKRNTYLNQRNISTQQKYNAQNRAVQMFSSWANRVDNYAQSGIKDSNMNTMLQNMGSQLNDYLDRYGNSFDEGTRSTLKNALTAGNNILKTNYDSRTNISSQSPAAKQIYDDVINWGQKVQQFYTTGGSSSAADIIRDRGQQLRNALDNAGLDDTTRDRILNVLDNGDLMIESKSPRRKTYSELLEEADNGITGTTEERAKAIQGAINTEDNWWDPNQYYGDEAERKELQLQNEMDGTNDQISKTREYLDKAKHKADLLQYKNLSDEDLNEYLRQVDAGEIESQFDEYEIQELRDIVGARNMPGSSQFEFWKDVSDEGVAKDWLGLYSTEDERKTYGYIKNTRGEAEAQKYLDTIRYDAITRAGQAWAEEVRNGATPIELQDKYGEIGKGLATVLTQLGANAGNVLTGFASLITPLGDAINSLLGNQANDTQTIRDIRTFLKGVQQSNALQATGGTDTVAQKLGNIVWQGTSSGIENVGNMYLSGKIADMAGITGATQFGINDVPGMAQSASSVAREELMTNLTILSMGSGAFQDGIQESKGKGYSDDEAMIRGFISGAIETITEKIGMDRMFEIAHRANAVQTTAEMIKEFAKSANSSGLAEGAEELVSNMANRVADDLIDRIKGIPGDTWANSIAEYEAQGMSESEAMHQYMMSIVDEDFEAFMSAYFSAAFMSPGIAELANNPLTEAKANLRNENGVIENETVMALVETGLEADTNSKAYKNAVNLQEKLARGEQISDKEVETQLERNIEYQNSQNAEDRLTEIANSMYDPLMDETLAAQDVYNRRADMAESRTDSAQIREQNEETKNTPLPKAESSQTRTSEVIENDYETILDIANDMYKNGMTAGAKVLSNMYESAAETIPAGLYNSVMLKYYQAGQTSLLYDEVTHPMGKYLTEQMKKAAYLAGEADQRTRIEKRGPAYNFTQDVLGRSWATEEGYGVVDNNAVRSISDSQTRIEVTKANTLAQKLGYRIEYITNSEEFNGRITDNTITISLVNAQNSVSAVLGHEVLHGIKNRDASAYSDFLEAAKDALGEEEFNRQFNATRDLYDRHGIEIDDDSISEEVAADYAGKLFDEGALNKFVQEHSEPAKRNMIQRLLDAVKNVLSKLKGKKNVDVEIVDKVQHAKDVLSRALEEMSGTENNEARNTGTKFSSKNDILAMPNVDWVDNNLSIRKQLQNHKEEISSMENIVDIVYTGESTTSLKEIIAEQLPALGGKRMKRGSVVFDFDKKGIDSIVGHADSDELRAAAIAAPYIAKKGILISGQKNHENTGLATLTYAGPATINGDRVHVGVAIQFSTNGRPRAVNVELDAGGKFYIKKAPLDTDGLTSKSLANYPPTVGAVNNITHEPKSGNIKTEIEDLGGEVSDGAITKHSLKTWNETDKKKLTKTLVNAGFSERQVNKWIRDVNGVANIIAENTERLDYIAAPNHRFLKANGDYYKKTLDASTLCAKRVLYQGTYDAIQHAMPNTPLTSDDVIRLRKLMKEMHKEVPCGICYVESQRKTLGKYAGEWLSTYKAPYIPTLDQVTTTDGLEALRTEHPETYNDFIKAMKSKGVQSPKVVELRTEYRQDVSKMLQSTVDYLNMIGGLRINSFSDFETPHVIDFMQAVMDMSGKGLKGMAYTKVPAFAWIFGGTGIKINLSLIPKTDANGNIMRDAQGRAMFDDVEGMPVEEALRIRDAYPDNVGTIVVGKDMNHVLEMLNDDRIDFVIPFHHSKWSNAEFEQLGLKGFEDFATGHQDNQVYPSEYWDYSKTGKENAERYLEICAERHVMPVFEQLLEENEDGSYSLKKDGSTDGYWKLIIEGKMYNHLTGEGAEQGVVRPEFNMEKAIETMNSYEGDPNSLPVAQDVVDRFIKEYKENNPRTKYSLKDNYGFYSQLENSLEEYKGDKIGANSVVSYLKGKGVKDEEIKWTGIQTYLEGKKSVSKADLIQYVRDNQLNITEKTLSLETAQDVWYDNQDSFYKYNLDPESYINDMDDSFSVERVKGDIDDMLEDGEIDQAAYDEILQAANNIAKNAGLRWEEYTLDGGDNYREILFQLPDSNYINPSMRIHWNGQEGVLAHARVQDFDTDGGKVLFVEEIQSDWHNAGQRFGYDDSNEPIHDKAYYADQMTENQKAFDADKRHGAFIDKLKEAGYTGAGLSMMESFLFDQENRGSVLRALGDITSEMSDYINEYTTKNDALQAQWDEAPRYHVSVPDAPFKNTYTDFVLKSLLRMAAEGDYNYLAWTTADMQSERWSDEYAEGYRIEYDQDIPKFLKKYGKQWGAALTTVDINDGEYTVPAIIVNNEMRNSILEKGQARYSLKFVDEEEVEKLEKGNQILQKENTRLAEKANRQQASIDEITKQKNELEAEVQRLVKENEEWKENVRYLRGQMQRTERVIEEKDLNRLIKKIIKGYDGTVKAADITRDMYEAANAFRLRPEDGYGKLKLAAYQAANRIIDSAQVMMEYGDGYEVRQYLHSRKVPISAKVKADIPDYNDTRKSYMGKMTMTTQDTGYTLEELYEELGKTFGTYLFPTSVMNPTDMLYQIMDVVDSDRYIFENPYDSDRAEIIDRVANDLISTAFDAKLTPATYADKMEIRYQKLTEKFEKMRRDNQMKVMHQMEDLRMENERKLQELKEHYKEMEAAKREKRNDADMRQRLLKVAKRVERIRKKTTAANQALIDELIGDLDLTSVGITGQSVQRLTDLRLWYEDQIATNDDFIPDERTRKELKRLSDKKISDLDLGDVAALTNSLLHIEEEIANFDKTLDTEDRRDKWAQGNESINDIENSYGRSDSALFNALTTGTLRPQTEMLRIVGYKESSPLYQRFLDLTKGQRNMIDYQRRAYSKYFDRFLNDKELMKSMTDKSRKIEIGGTSKDGTQWYKLRITPDMLMSLYMHSLNNENMRHIQEGGVEIPDYDLYVKGKFKQAAEKSTKITINRGSVRKWASEYLTEKEMAFIHSARNYYKTMSQPEINSTSEKLVGYPVAKVENYWRIVTDSNWSQTQFDQLKFDGTIEGEGWTKERQFSKLPVQLLGFSEQLRKDIEAHSRYIGMAIPIRNFNKVYGITRRSFDANGDIISGYENSVMRAIKEKWGDKANQYIQKMMTDIQNPKRTSDEVASFLGKMRGNYAAAVLNLNASVAIKQAASYPTAAAEIGWEPLLKAISTFPKTKGKSSEFISQYSPLMRLRTDGYSNVDLADIKKQGKELPKSLNWIQKIDVGTVRLLWLASEYYVRSNNPDLTVGSEEYYKEVGNVHTRVIEATQPNYTALQRPQLLRADSDLTRTLMMFKTQPFQNFNILYESIGNLRAQSKAFKNNPNDPTIQKAYKQAKTRFAWAVSSQLMSSFVFALMQFAWDAFRKKDDKYTDEEGEYTFLSWAKGMGINMASNGAGMIPFGSELFELGTTLADKITDALGGKAFFDAQFYGLDTNAATDSINNIGTGILKAGADIASIINSLKSNGEDVIIWEDYARDLVQIGEDVAAYIGIPADNVKKTLTALAKQILPKTVGEYVGEYFAARISDGVKNKKEYIGILRKAYENDKEQYQRLYEIMTQDDKFATSSSTAQEYIDKQMKDLVEADALKESRAQIGMTEADSEKWEQILSQYDPEGKGNQANVYAALQASGYSEQRKKSLWEEYGWGTSYEDYAKKQNALDAIIAGRANVGLTDSDIQKYEDALDKHDYDNNGRPNQEETYWTLVDLALSKSQTEQLWGEKYKGSFADYKPKTEHKKAESTKKKTEEKKTEEEKPQEDGYINVSNSSFIAGYQYDRNSGQLTVDLTSGRRYTYNVSPEVYEGLKNADSPGGYYNTYIKG